MQKMKDIWMNPNFIKVVDRLKQSSRELDNMSTLDVTDEYVRLELLLKFHEINKIVSMCEDMLTQNPKEESLQLLNE